MTTNESNPLRDAAAEVVKTWEQCPDTVVSMTLDCQIRALRAALAAPEPEPEAAVAVAVDMFVSDIGKRFFVLADGRVFVWVDSEYRLSGLNCSVEYWLHKFPRDVHCSKENTANWLAQHGTPGGGGR